MASPTRSPMDVSELSMDRSVNISEDTGVDTSGTEASLRVMFDPDQFRGLLAGKAARPVPPKQAGRPSSASPRRTVAQRSITPTQGKPRPQSAHPSRQMGTPAVAITSRPHSATTPRAITPRGERSAPITPRPQSSLSAYAVKVPVPMPVVSATTRPDSARRRQKAAKDPHPLIDKETLVHELWTAKKTMMQISEERNLLKTELLRTQEELRRKERSLDEFSHPQTGAGEATPRQQAVTKDILATKLKEVIRELRASIKAKDAEIAQLKSDTRMSKVQHLEADLVKALDSGKRLHEMVQKLRMENTRLDLEQREEIGGLQKMEAVCVELTTQNRQLKGANKKLHFQIEQLQQELTESLDAQTRLNSVVSELEKNQKTPADMRILARPPFHCVKTLYGHSDSVLAIVCASNRVFTGSWDGTVRVWDSTDFRELGIWQGCERGVFSLAVRGDTLLLGGGNGQLRVLDLESGRALKQVSVHSGSVYAIVILDDGRVVTSSADHAVKLWRVDGSHEFKCVATLDGHTDAVRALAVATNRGILFTGSDDRSIRAWRLDTNECIHVLAGHSDWVSCLAVGGGGCLWSGSFKEVKVWDIDSMQCRHTLHCHTNHVRAVLVHNENLLTAAGDCNIQVTAVEGYKARYKIIGHTSTVWAMQLVNGRLWSVASDGTVRVWTFQ